MNLLNSFRIKLLIFLIIPFLFIFESCNKKNIINYIDCDNKNDLNHFTHDFKSFLNNDIGFLSIKEINNKYIIETYDPRYSYKENNILVQYSHKEKILLIDSELHDISKINEILKNRVYNYISEKKIKLDNTLNLEKYSQTNSQLIFNIKEAVFVDERKKNNQQALSTLYILKKINCIIDEIRNEIAIKLYKKAYQNIDYRDKTILRNIVPKIYYIHSNSPSVLPPPPDSNR